MKIVTGIKITGFIAAALILSLNSSFNLKSNSNNVDLSELIKLSEAGAHCEDQGWPWNDGRCNDYGVCYMSSFYAECYSGH